jgi:shikimate kinase
MVQDSNLNLKNIQNVYLIGPMGAGKTSIGKALAADLGLQFYDSDQVIEERAGVDIPWIYDLEGEEGFRQREKKVIAELVQLKGIVLATGGGTVALPENRAALATNGTIIYLQTTLENQLQRVSQSKKRPIVTEELERRKLLEALHTKYEPLYLELADFVYHTDHKPTAIVIAEIKKLLASENN